MVNAPVSPIATQETVEKIAKRILDAGLVTCQCGMPWDRREDPCLHVVNGTIPACIPANQSLIAEIEDALRAEREALSSAERRIEELGRERLAAWMIQHSIATGHGDTFDDLLGELSGFVTTLKAEVEELKREMTTWIEAGFKARADATAAESRLGEKRCRSN